MFFSPINWDDLNAKKITPPFNPNVVRSHLNAQLQPFLFFSFFLLSHPKTNKQSLSPFQTGPNDLRHFDPEFTDEPVPSSIGCSPDSVLITASIKEAAEAFVGFSYAPSMDSYL